MYYVPLAVASRYGHGLWFSTRTQFSSANGAQRARRCQSLSEPGSIGSSQARVVPSALAVTTRAPSGLNRVARVVDHRKRATWFAIKWGCA
jgi:hypothetical protein